LCDRLALKPVGKPKPATRPNAPAGKTPVAFVVGGTRQKLSMIATVTNKGQTRWMIIGGAFNSDRLIEFLEALINSTLSDWPSI